MNKKNYQKELEKIIDSYVNPKMASEKDEQPKYNDYLEQDNSRPTLLLHSCCAPCSSYCMEYMREYFDVTVFYYNPNISSSEEYWKRLEEEKRLIEAYNEQVMNHSFQVIERTPQIELPPQTKQPSLTEPPQTEQLTQVATQSFQSFQMNSTAKASRINIIEGDYRPEVFFEMAKGLEECPEGGNRCFKCYELRLRESFRIAKENNLDFVTTTLTISPLKNADKINEIGYKLAEEYGVKWLPSDFKKKNGYKRSIELSEQFGLYRQNYCGCDFSKRQ